MEKNSTQIQSVTALRNCVVEPNIWRVGLQKHCRLDNMPFIILYSENLTFALQCLKRSGELVVEILSL